MRPESLRSALAATVDDLSWLDAALRRVAVEPRAITRLFPSAGAHCGGRTGIAPGWSAEDAGRVLLLAAVPLRGKILAAEAEALYRCGDLAERRAVLKALPMLPIGDAAIGLVYDAIATDEPQLLAAALGPYAIHLDDSMWRRAVLQCVVRGLHLGVVYGLGSRADDDLTELLADLAAQWHAGGRDLPPDARDLLNLLLA